MVRFVLLLLFSALSMICRGQFTAGNLVVSRVGDGVTSLSNASAQVQLVEYSTSGAATGMLVTLPTVSGGAGNRACTNSGSSSTEGMLTLSEDGRFLVHTGYDAPPGVAGISSEVSDPNRVIALVDAGGSVNTSTSFASSAGNAYTKNSIRGVVTVDGSGFWASGNGNSGSGGVRYISFGQDNVAGTLLSTDVVNTRGISIYDGQLYISSASGSFRVASVGSGTPVLAGQSIVNLPGIPVTGMSPKAFLFLDTDPAFDGPELLYVACQDISSTLSGLRKFNYNGSTWEPMGSIVTNAQLLGITGYLDCDNQPVLFVTRAVSGSAPGTEIRRYTDLNGRFAALSGDAGDFLSESILLQTAGANCGFRGICFSPGGGLTISGSQAVSAGTYHMITIRNGGIATLSGDISVSGRIVVESGGILDPGDYIVSSPSDVPGTFELQDGGFLRIGHPDGIAQSAMSGNIQTCRRYFSQHANYEYNGSAPQITGDGLPQFINSTGSLKINNSAGIGTSGVTLTGWGPEIRGTLDLSLGKFSIPPGHWPNVTETGSIVNYSANSFVEGPLGRSGFSSLFFPVGRGNQYAPIELSAGNPNDLFVAEYFTGDPRAGTGYNFENPPVHHMSTLEWWTLDNYYSVSSRKVTLYARTYSDATKLADLRVLRWDGSIWKNAGNSAYSGVSVGPVTSDTVLDTEFFPSWTPTPFTFGSVTATENPLPINLLWFTARKISNKTAELAWRLGACCSPEARFEVERANETRVFKPITTRPGSDSSVDYNCMDTDLQPGVNYYRLKMINADGTVIYSRVATVLNGLSGLQLVSVATETRGGNPRMTIVAARPTVLGLVVTDMAGRTVFREQIQVPGGNVVVELPVNQLAAGIYRVQGFTPGGKTNLIGFRVR